VRAGDLPARYRAGVPESEPTPTALLATANAPAPALAAANDGVDPSTLSPTTTLPPQGIDLRTHIANVELELIRAALAQAGGVVAHAAPLLGLRRTTLVEKLRKYGIDRDGDTNLELAAEA
jgi:sigma-54 specific flagellar transcriptional regulator A